jgi:calcineurin-like phosphoesterase family protein
MSDEIVIVPDGERYHLVHGHLHLANLLAMSKQVKVEVPGVGTVTIFKTRAGLRVNNNIDVVGRQLE